MSIPMRHPEVDGGTFAVNEEQAQHLEGLGWQRVEADDPALPEPLVVEQAAVGSFVPPDDSDDDTQEVADPDDTSTDDAGDGDDPTQES